MILGGVTASKAIADDDCTCCGPTQKCDLADSLPGWPPEQVCYYIYECSGSGPVCDDPACSGGGIGAGEGGHSHCDPGCACGGCANIGCNFCPPPGP
jgi:hypothetical protein